MSVPSQKDRKRRIAADIDETDARALELNAKENGRSLMSEIRIAIKTHLKTVGRRA